jgi:hypothetical protein
VEDRILADAEQAGGLDRLEAGGIGQLRVPLVRAEAAPIAVRLEGELAD